MEESPYLRGPLRLAAWLSVLALTGCAIARVPVALRTEVDARPVEGETQVFLLSGSSAPSGTRGYCLFVGDTLVIYRPVQRTGTTPAYRREFHRVGRSGFDVAGYTLADGRHVRFKGTVKQSGDRLIFHRASPGRSMEKIEKPSEVSLAMSEVRALDAILPDTGQTVIMFSTLTLMTLTALGLSFKASMSEPLF